MDCLTDIPNLNLSYCYNIRDVSALENINNIDLDYTHLIEDGFKKENIIDDIQEIELFDNETNKNIKIKLINIEFDTMIYYNNYRNYQNFEKYLNIDYLENKQFVIINNWIDESNGIDE